MFTTALQDETIAADLSRKRPIDGPRVMGGWKKVSIGAAVMEEEEGASGSAGRRGRTVDRTEFSGVNGFFRQREIHLLGDDMKNLSGDLAREGFTLIEILVVLILLAILAAAVFPVLTQQTDDADPVRVANDLSSIKTGVQTFRLDLRPEFPGDLEDLAYAPAATVERSVRNIAYGGTLAGRWNGPYIDTGLAQGLATTAQETGNAVATGFGAQIQNDIVCFNRATNAATGVTCVNGTHSVALRITGLTEEMFNGIDEVIDGSASATEGNFRQVTPSNDAYYFLSPFH